MAYGDHIPLGEQQQLDIPADPGIDPAYQADGFSAFNLGIKRENPWAKSFSNFVLDVEEPDFEEDPSYDFINDEANIGYDPEEMFHARSDAEASHIRGQIDIEREEMGKINSSNWGMAGQIFGGIFQPQHLAAAFVAPQSLAATVGAEMMVEGATEIALQQQQRTRTTFESTINVASAGAGTALLGGAYKYFQKIAPDEAAQLQADLNTPNTFPVGDEASPGLSFGESAGSAKTDPLDPEGDVMVGGKWANAFALGPMNRLMQSDDPYTRSLAQRLANSPFFTRAMEKGNTTGQSVEALSDAGIGRVAGTIEEVGELQKVAKKESGMDAKTFDEEVGVAMSNGDKHPNPQVQKAAEMYRERVLTPILEAAQDLGMLPKVKSFYDDEIQRLEKEHDASPAKSPEQQAARDTQINELHRLADEAPTSLTKFGETYFPRVYRKDKILKHWDELKHTLKQTFRQADPEKDIYEIDEQVERTMQNMMGGLPIANRGGAGGPAALKPRVLELTDAVLEPYLDKNASSVILRHASSMIPHIEMKQAFGEVSMADQIETIGNNYQKLIDAAPNEKARTKLNKRQARDIKDIELMRDRLSGNIQRGLDPTNPVAKVLKGVKLWNVLTQLGGIAISSIPDMARPLMAYGFRSHAKGIAMGVVQAFGKPGSLPSAQVKRTGVALQRVLNDRLLQLTDDLTTGSGTMNKLQWAWGKATLFDTWTNVMESVAAHSAMDWVIRQAGNAAGGKTLSRSVKGRLARMGFSEEDLAAIYKESSKTMGAQDTTLKYANTMEWDDLEMAKRFEAGIGGDVRNAIIRLGAGDKPGFMDDSTWSWLLQYQSFAIGATNKMLVAGMQQRDLNAASGLLAMLFLGGSTGAIKAMARGEDPSEWSEEQWLMESIDRSGFAGAYNIPLNALRWVGGTMGYLEDMPSRYVHRQWESVFGGPTSSNIGRVVRAGTTAVEGDFDKSLEHIARVTPFISNTLHLRQLMQRMGEQ